MAYQTYTGSSSWTDQISQGAASQPPMGQAQPPAKEKNKAVLIIVSVIGALAVLFGGIVLFSDSSDPGQGSTYVVNLTDLTPAEMSAIQSAQTGLGEDLSAADEQTLLDNAYACIEQADSGWTFAEIEQDNMQNYGMSQEYSNAVMDAAFVDLAPEYGQAYTEWWQSIDG